MMLQCNMEVNHHNTMAHYPTRIYRGIRLRAAYMPFITSYQYAKAQS